MSRETVTLPDRTQVEVEIPDLASEDALMRAILDTPAVNAAVDAAAKAAYPSIHWRHGNDGVGSEAAGKVVDAFLRSGEISDAEEIILGWVDESEHYRNLRKDNFSTRDESRGWGLFMSSAVEALGRSSGLDLDREDMAETFRDVVEEALAEADTTSPLDQLDQARDIGVVYIHGVGDGAHFDDLYMRGAISSQCSATDVRPDGNFRNFLQFLNMGSDDYRAAVQAIHGIDLLAIPASEDTTAYRRERLAELSKEWQDFSFEADAARPALVTPEQAVELLDNASYGGVPVAYAHVEPKAFLNLPWAGSPGGQVLLEPSRDRGRILIGIHDFMNGSGHSVDVPGPVTLPLKHAAWHVDGTRYKYGVDSVYGLVKSIFSARVSAVEAVPALEAEAPSGPRV